MLVEALGTLVKTIRARGIAVWTFGYTIQGVGIAFGSTCRALRCVRFRTDRAGMRSGATGSLRNVRERPAMNAYIAAMVGDRVTMHAFTSAIDRCACAMPTEPERPRPPCSRGTLSPPRRTGGTEATVVRT